MDPNEPRPQSEPEPKTSQPSPPLPARERRERQEGERTDAAREESAAPTEPVPRRWKTITDPPRV
jgi:hypothetical protein